MATPRNDGWHDAEYNFGSDAEDNTRLSGLLNEACHVFHHHADGHWKSHDRDAYAARLVAEIAKRPGLVGRLLATDDRVIKMLTYRAIELAKLR